MRVLIAIALLLSCATVKDSEKPAIVKTSLVVDIQEKPNQESAVKAIWRHFFLFSGKSIEDRHPPTVSFFAGNTFQCGDNNWCSGAYVKLFHLVILAWPNDAFKFHQSALAHELCHAYFKDDNQHSICIEGLPPIETANEVLRKLDI